MITAVYSYMLEKNPVLYQVSAYLVSYCLLLRQQQRFEHPTLKQTSVLLGCIQNSTISSKRVRCCTNKHTNRGHNLHGRVVGRKKIKKGTNSQVKNKIKKLLSSLAVSAAVRTWCGGETSTRKTSTSISNAMLLKK